jgi:hypothetical protein
MTHPATHRLNQEQRDEMTRRVLAGETATALGKEFGVTRAYVALLKAQALDPERFIRKRESKLSLKLTAAELKKFDETLSSSTPADHDLVPTSERWSLEHGHQLAWKLFKKHPSVRVIKECLTPYMPKREDFRFTRPQPPKPHHINQISPDLAKDPDYVAYYLSPICEQIAWREYEMAVADWDARFAETEEQHDEEMAMARNQQPSGALPPERIFAPGQRTGKHAKSKGSSHTPPKRRKKRR